MKKFVLILGMVFLGCSLAQAEDTDYSQLAEEHITEWLDEEGFPLVDEPDFNDWSIDVTTGIERFKKLLKTKNTHLIAQNVVYPYYIGRGVPSIKNEQEFLEKYDTILPKSLRLYLIDAPMKHWGYDFSDGTICLYWCYNAKITPDGKIIHVRTTKKLKEYRNELIAAEKKLIHPSLNDYNYNLYTMETDEWLIRIDDMKGRYKQNPVNGRPKENYRFAAWKKGKTISDEPDIVIDHGTRNAPSRWGGQKFTFSSPEYYCTLTEDSKRIRLTDVPKFRLHLYKGMISAEPEIK